MASKEDVCELLDKLTIDLLDLIEQQTQCQLNIENCVIDGQLNIAKFRYLKGAQSVSSAHMPTENSPEFSALVTVTQTNDNSTTAVDLQRHPVDREQGFIEPLNWFGILVPNCMHAAQQKFQKSLEYVCEAVNIQNSLQSTMKNILKLKEMKNGMQE